MDSIRLDRLNDPDFKFAYAVRPSGEVLVSNPISALCKDFHYAIDKVRCHNKEMPACIKCSIPLNETNQTHDGLAFRYDCKNCSTSFIA